MQEGGSTERVNCSFGGFLVHGGNFTSRIGSKGTIDHSPESNGQTALSLWWFCAKEETGLFPV